MVTHLVRQSRNSRTMPQGEKIAIFATWLRNLDAITFYLAESSSDLDQSAGSINRSGGARVWVT
jgi:hypothetical protein